MDVKELIKNFKTTNTMNDACQRDWCISPMPSAKLKQVEVKLPDGKTENYACRYTAKAESVALIGYSIGFGYDEVVISPNTGVMGNVVDTLEKLFINRRYAVEVDYIFNPTAEKKALTECVKYLNFGPESYNKTLQFGKFNDPIRPIIYYIRRILSAASILAHPKLVKSDDIEKAKTAVFAKMSLDEKMVELEWDLPECIGIVLSDFQVPDTSVKNELCEITKELSKISNSSKWNGWHEKNGKLISASDIGWKFVELDIVNDFVNKYAHIGAISIMIRGGFSNLLRAYLSVNPPIDEYVPQILNALKKVGYSETYKILKTYKEYQSME